MFQVPSYLVGGQMAIITLKWTENRSLTGTVRMSKIQNGADYLSIHSFGRMVRAHARWFWTCVNVCTISLCAFLFDIGANGPTRERFKNVIVILGRCLTEIYDLPVLLAYLWRVVSICWSVLSLVPKQQVRWSQTVVHEYTCVNCNRSVTSLPTRAILGITWQVWCNVTNL